MSENQHVTLLGKIAAYTEILVKDPRSTIFVSLAETYRKMGMFDDARQIIAKGLELHPDFAPAHIVMARVLCQVDDYTGSEEFFERALELDPDSLAAFVGFARVKILLGKEDEARDLLLKARELSPADPVINKLLLTLPQEPESVVESKIDDAESEKVPFVSVTLAELYLKQGLKDEALKVYRDLLVHSPDDLDLRRKIKELENGADEKDIEIPAPESTSEPEGVTPEDVEEDDRGADFDRNGKADDMISPVNSIAPESAEDTVLETLSQWLDNIKQRREHV